MALATLTQTGRAGHRAGHLVPPLASGMGLRRPYMGRRRRNPAFPRQQHRTGQRAGPSDPLAHRLRGADEAGGIVIPVATGSEGAVQEARYRLATEPTPYLYVQTAYAYSDASNAIIREMGLFMDTEFVEGLPEGQRYFVPDDLKNPGLLLAAQIILPRINRSPSVRQTVEFVLPI